MIWYVFPSVMTTVTGIERLAKLKYVENASCHGALGKGVPLKLFSCLYLKTQFHNLPSRCWDEMSKTKLKQ